MVDSAAFTCISIVHWFSTSTGQDFLRRREVAIDNIMQSTEEERKQFLRDSLLKRPVPKESNTVLEKLKGPAFTKIIQRAEKTEDRKRKRQTELSEQQPPTKTRRTIGQETRWCQPKTNEGPSSEHPVPGVALTAVLHDRPSKILEKLGFKVLALGSDPGTGAAAFLREAWKMRSMRPMTHLVLCRDLKSDDHGLLGAAARLSGAFLCQQSSLEKLPPAGPSGVQFEITLRKKRLLFIHEDHAKKIKGLVTLVHAAASCPGSGVQVYSSLKKLKGLYSMYRSSRGPKSKPWLQMRALAPLEVTKLYHKEFPWLTCETSAFFDFLHDKVDRNAICPGNW